MKIIDFLGNVFNKSGEKINNIVSIGIGDGLPVKRFAEEVAIDLIAGTVARSEFLTFQKGVSVREKNYYLLNIESNQNQAASKFWENTVRKILVDGEALIIMKGDKHYLADSFIQEEYVFKENIYKDIIINNGKLDNEFSESQVFYFNKEQIRKNSSLNSITGDYKDLISSSIKGFHKKNVSKGKMKVPTNYPQTDEAQEELRNLFEKQMKDFLDPTKDSVLPEQNGLEYTDLTAEKGSKSHESERTTRTLIDDVFDFVAMSYGIPPSLLKGNTVDTKDAVNNFLTFCINPLAEVISDEINRKMYGYELYKERTYCKLDTTKIKNVDIRDVANSLELLTRTGSHTINDNLKSLGLEPVNEDWANERFMTTNNMPVKVMVEQGGSKGYGKKNNTKEIEGGD